VFYEKKHFAYRPTIGGSSIPADRLINDLNERAIYYIGTFSEYYPIHRTTTGFGTNMCMVIDKRWSDNPTFKHDIKLKGFSPDKATGYHSQDFNNNGGIRLSKQDLLQLANAMDEDDVIHITAPDSLNTTKFDESVKITCK